MTGYALGAGLVVGAERDHADAWLVVRDGAVAGISEVPPADLPHLQLGDVRIAPGLVDVHIHGREGRDVMDAQASSLRAISRSLARHGVTGFLATTVTSSWSRTLDALRTVGELAGRPMPGARLLGAYSEGLFFCCAHKGAHNEAFFLPPSIERVDAMADAAGGSLRALALAPEIEGAMEVVAHASRRGIKVVLGHTDATYEQVCAALELGAAGGVHLFNGMRGIHHRDPGCAGALLLERCTVEVIADGVHLHPAVIRLIARLKRADEILLISDCMCAGGLPDGRFRLGEIDVNVSDGVARTDAGGLAGSTLTLDRAVARLAAMREIGFRGAVHMASLHPARFAGVDDRVGSLAPGKRADLAIFGSDGTVLATVVDGRAVHVADGWPRAPLLEGVAGASEGRRGEVVMEALDGPADVGALATAEVRQ